MIIKMGEIAVFSADPEKPTEYLPSPRTKDNPNARGGAINVLPRAPNLRLDECLNEKKIQK